MKTLLEINEAQRRQLIDSEALFDALTTAQEEARKHQGFMFWRTVQGREYLIRSGADSKQSSIGPKSAETEAIFDRFMSRKAALDARLKDLKEQSSVAQRLNKALRVGRAPDILVATLQTLRKAQVDQHFLVVGTNALYAYETAAGVRFPTDVMETRDADFLYDTRKRASFLQVMATQKKSFLDLLREVDKTFERHPTDNYTAVNSKGYEVDLIRRFPPTEHVGDGDAEHPLRMTAQDGDLWAVRASTGERLLSAPRFDQVVISTSGAMACMRTVHPLHFARIKVQLAASPERDPRKATKDKAQAEMVTALVHSHLPHLLTDKPQARTLEAEGDGEGSSVERPRQ